MNNLEKFISALVISSKISQGKYIKQSSRVVKLRTHILKLDSNSFKSWIFYTLAVQPQTGYLRSLIYGILILNVGLLLVTDA